MALAGREAEYERITGKHLEEAERLLRRGDDGRASEKFWGVAAEIIKAVGAQRRCALGTHRSLREFVERLDAEHPDWRLLDAMAHAESLHINFYEDHLPEKSVRRSADVMRQFIANLRTLLYARSGVQAYASG